ncbi:MAG: hypothetical protein WCG61_06740 [Chlorobium sp.]
MGKKDKSVFALAEDFEAVVALVPKLRDFFDAHKEIAAGYQKYRKNGGEAIPGIEKHLSIKEQISAPSKKTKDSVKTREAKLPKEAKAAKKTVESTPAKKTGKKDKK